MPGPFFFDWCAEGTAWGAGRLVEDEKIESFALTHSEGDFATLTIVVKNPRIGPLHASRQTWCWFSLDIGFPDTSNIVPLFYGQLIAVPTDIAGDAISFVFRAMPPKIAERKAAVADSLRVRPFYDDLFVDLSQRDDPDTVLEGYASLWHVDRVNHAVTVSSITQGEDGTEIFTADEVPRDSVTSELSQTPLMMVGVDATVKWQQKTRGVVDVGAKVFISYSGDGIMADWPKTGASLGGGYSVLSGLAFDASGSDSALNTAWSFHWQNRAKKHHNGDTMSVSISSSGPADESGVGGNVTTQKQTGFLDPYAIDENGDPQPINIPAWIKTTGTMVVGSSVRTGLLLQYDTDRARSERVLFTVGADLQPMIGTSVDPHAGEEAIIMSDVDAGAPIIRLRSWYNVRSMAVALGDVVFPEYPGFPGFKIGQIVVVAGTTGAQIPQFSPIIGDITVDGTAQWSSLGPVDPSTTVGNWPKQAAVVVGTTILPDVPLVLSYRDLNMVGAVQWPVGGVPVEEGRIVRGNNGSYHICTQAGTTEVRSQPWGYGIPSDPDSFSYVLYTYPISEPFWPTTWGSETLDGTVVWFSLGMTLPNGSQYQICTQSGTTGEFPPPFATTIGGTTADGTVVWATIGQAQIPVGGAVGNIIASSYFPTDRGRESLEYLICKARSKLLYAARAVKVSFDCKIDRAVTLSCRKNALLETPQLPGGQAFGKITEYTIRGDGEGKMNGTVTIGCTIGKGNTVTESAGEPTYVKNGYVKSGYQQYENQTVAMPSVGDVGYSPPVNRTIDDGLVFPLTRAQIVEKEIFYGSLADQEAGIMSAINSSRQAAEITQGGAHSQQESLQQQRQLQAMGSYSIGQALTDNPIEYELHLKPLIGTSYAALYSIKTLPLVAPKHIDLEAAST